MIFKNDLANEWHSILSIKNATYLTDCDAGHGGACEDGGGGDEEEEDGQDAVTQAKVQQEQAAGLPRLVVWVRIWTMMVVP